jgi:hypothetical protein
VLQCMRKIRYLAEDKGVEDEGVEQGVIVVHL